MKEIFKNCCFREPISILHAHCGKNKIDFKMETTKGDEESERTWTTTVIFEGASISGVGHGRRSKEVAAVAALTYLKQQGKFDNNATYISELDAKIRASDNIDDPSLQINYMNNFLKETPNFSTDDGIDVEIDERKSKEYTTTLDFARIKGIGKSVNGKKASKREAILDWIVKYERANKVKIEDLINKQREAKQLKNAERRKEFIAGKKAELEAKKALELENDATAQEWN